MGTTKIDRARVAETALRLLNETGLDGLTLRAIAKELDVQAPALYWHFKNKQELLDEMATAMYRRMLVEETADLAGRGWRERIIASQTALRTALLRYRDGAKVFSGARFTGIDHAPGMEEHLRVMVDAGFDLRQAVRATATVNAYTMGFVTEEQGVEPMPGERHDGYDVSERAARMADFPLVAEAGAELFTRYDELFAEGLRILVAGIGARYGVE
ncbi:TetR/AcrR family transcriptional regulator C-terminal domain-containing protein [Streptomyces sp. NBC_00247]|uniref:TetR/AcrR family transcriptional regulator C-terminal domain-containing protein n=1 Tax=Streptomyces sp. NBC_00247 TaxID=2975689 RepID=UPI002E2CC750|nr:TetR/AcrR family transcriptional regulator C-terminal domain-containing protein [Streptomyces sp. NBC_00247]